MTDMNDQNQEVIDSTERAKPYLKPKKTGLKRFFSTVGAGVIGSALTLTAVTYTPLLKDANAINNNSAPESTVQTANDSSYSVQKVSANTKSLADMVESTSKAIVGVVNFQNKRSQFSPIEESVEVGSGSGVVFKKDGNEAYIVTNNHVIEGAQKIEVSFYNGEKAKAELVGSDALTDLAVLKVDGKYADTVLKFGNSDALRAGDQVVAIGNPLGLDFSRTVTQGIVSAVNRTVNVNTSAGEWDLNAIQTDAAINPGNSGGALINSNGELVGINSLKISESGVEGLGFAIPINDAIPIIDEIIKSGKIERPYMGVSLADLDQIPPQYLRGVPVTVEDGVMVAAIEPKSAAEKAGLEVKDLIVSVNKNKVKNSGELRRYLYTKLKAGDKLSLEVYRDGKLKTINLTLASK
ncbi:S1C family serine protease [Lederbergia wuyishanensis]|uniref:Serine protease Do n=1 Tax=Lederbergia wuyishanensis TaxID=1347903 RepID=A0ABU0DA51_9BACI|nr:trypsin-like peptidase domain-containing protein [Lederbergia wuyishanensis]MCJ8009952.1 trypsin-like peptidase domain-containing protein [Lederbergia wuyishanensis]MDQ0345299.1 serine protease Do [Lederbergia wuyishanensis]